MVLDRHTTHFHRQDLSAYTFASVSPKTFNRYVDGSHARFENKQKSLRFLEILNKQDSSFQYNIDISRNWNVLFEYTANFKYKTTCLKLVETATEGVLYSRVGYRFLGDMLDKSTKLTEMYLCCIKFIKILKNHFSDISGPENTRYFSYAKMKFVPQISLVYHVF